MKAKKIIALILAMVMALSLVACGGGSDGDTIDTDVNKELRQVLPGIWEITSWDLTAGGYLNVAEGWYLVYTDDTIKFYMDGAQVNEESYTWISENTLHAIYLDDPSYTVDWSYELKDDGTMVITDEANGLIYYTEKRPDDTDPTAYVPSTPAGGSEDALTIDPADLVGTWNLNSMIIAGTETPVADQTFVFTEDSVQYVVSGAMVNDNTYTWIDASNLKIVNKADETAVVEWNLALQADGTLIITDTTNGLGYSCTKQA